MGVVELDRERVEVFIPNPGRMNELMLPEKTMYVKEQKGSHRKTDYTLIGVEHDGVLVSIDSNKPNRFMKRMLTEHKLDQFQDYSTIKSEPRYNSGRFDFLLEGDKSCFIEVKSCTLVEDGLARFPDAPTIRGARHVRHLAKSLQNRVVDDAAVVFVIQRPDAEIFSPHWSMDPDFARDLYNSQMKGVRVIALRTEVVDWELRLLGEIPTRLCLPASEIDC